MNEAYNVDCMEYMRTLPDKAFDLAVVDPPYGDAGTQFKGAISGRFGGKFEKYTGIHRVGGQWAGKYGTAAKNWDITPPPEYFAELFRVSKNQIIWGGNYFGLPATRCFLVWDKININEQFSMSMCEFAWTSLQGNAKIFRHVPQGRPGQPRIHPTQKPVELYKWIYAMYAQPGDKILDTHLGSGSSRIAAYDIGLDFVGCEIDPDYFKAQEARYQAHIAQHNLFLCPP